MQPCLEAPPQFKTLRYSHSRKYNCNLRCWDICKFGAAVERQVGSHLVELSVSIRDALASIAQGKVSMRGSACLRQLEFPLQIVMYHMAAAAYRVSTSNESLIGGSPEYELDNGALFIGDLVPPPVIVLSLISHGTHHHGKVLEVIFWDFAARKKIRLPALKEIHLICPMMGTAHIRIIVLDCQAL